MIEIEDQRLATVFDVAADSHKKFSLKPHLDGFTLTQLLDRLNTYVVAAGLKSFRIGYRGTFGTALFLSKYFQLYFPDVQLVCSIEQETIDDTVYRRLATDYPNIGYLTLSDNLFSAETFAMFSTVDLVLIAPFYDYKFKRFKHFFQESMQNPSLKDKSCIVVDSVKARKGDSRGDYYMGSCVWSAFDKAVAKVRFSGTNTLFESRRQVIEARNFWKNLHCYAGGGSQGSNAAFVWLEKVLEPQIVKISYAFYRFYLDYKVKNPPNFNSIDSYFNWGVDFHNAVNRHIGKPVFSFLQAYQRWWPHLCWQKQQPSLKNVLAVTSLSPLKKHCEVQKEVLTTWFNLGLEVVSGNSAEECESLKLLYPEVTFKAVGLSKSFSRATPKIRDLISLGGDLPILLINSDIAIYGNQQLITKAISNQRSFVGVRQNWTHHPGHGDTEPWGIDAFLLFPEQVKTFPDIDLAIGQPFWDYWVPYHLEQNNFAIDWITYPYFYHKNHPLNWDQKSHTTGNIILNNHYGYNIDWSDWRRTRPYFSLDYN